MTTAELFQAVRDATVLLKRAERGLNTARAAVATAEQRFLQARDTLDAARAALEQRLDEEAAQV